MDLGLQAPRSPLQDPAGDEPRDEPPPYQITLRSCLRSSAGFARAIDVLGEASEGADEAPSEL